MAQEDLQKHLDNALYGTPLLKPDEQRKYLGTFRERCYLTMTLAEMNKNTNRTNLLKELPNYANCIVLLNGAMDSDLQAAYLKILNDQQIKFTIVNDAVTNAPDALGLVVAAKAAVNEKVIDIEQKYPATDTSSTTTAEKKSFWQQLFH